MEWTKEALEAITKPKLYDLAVYYELDVTTRNLKAEIIDAIMEHLNKTIVEPDRKAIQEELPEMSVRVRRIYNQNKEN